jgi:hypothetical protein
MAQRDSATEAQARQFARRGTWAGSAESSGTLALAPEEQAVALRGISGPGAPLEPGIRRGFERRLGTDLGDVRVHTDAEADASARAIGAAAYTLGSRVAFTADRYRPTTAAGSVVLAHELAHVAQQRNTGVPVVARFDVWDVVKIVSPGPGSVAKQVAGALDTSGIDVLKAGARYILGDTLWSLLKALVSGFEVGLAEVPEEQRKRILRKFGDIDLGDAYEYGEGFALGVLEGLWSGLTSLVEAVITLLQLPKKIYDFVNSLPQLAARYAPRVARLMQDANELVARLKVAFARDSREAMGQVERLMDAVGEAVLERVREAGRSLAKRLVGFIDQDWEDIGRDVGRVTGRVLFEALLAFATDFVGNLVKEGAALAARLAEGTIEALRAIGGILGRVIESLGRVVRGFASDTLELLKPLRKLLEELRALLGEALGAEAETAGTGGVRASIPEPPRPTVMETSTPKKAATSADVTSPSAHPSGAPAPVVRTVPQRVVRASAQVERELAEERAVVTARKSELSADEWRSARAGATKKLYNLLERRAVLERMRAFPGRTYLEQVEIVGVKARGQISHVTEISRTGKGRIADILELDGRQATLVDLKSPSTQIGSVRGGMSSADLEVEFRSASEIGEQHAVEREVIQRAKANGGTVVIRGRDPINGALVEKDLDPNLIQSRVTDYANLGGS